MNKQNFQLKCKLEKDISINNLLNLTRQTLKENGLSYMYRNILIKVLESEDYVEAVEILCDYIDFYI